MKNYRLVCSPLSERFLIARFGKDQDIALETKDATSDFFKALAAYAFDHKMPEIGAKVQFNFGGGDELFCVTIERIEKQND